MELVSRFLTWSRRYWTTVTWLFVAALWRGVCPSLSISVIRHMARSWLARSLTISSKPCPHAKWKAVVRSEAWKPKQQLALSLWSAYQMTCRYRTWWKINGKLNVSSVANLSLVFVFNSISSHSFLEIRTAHWLISARSTGGLAFFFCSVSELSRDQTFNFSEEWTLCNENIKFSNEPLDISLVIHFVSTAWQSVENNYIYVWVFQQSKKPYLNVF